MTFIIQDLQSIWEQNVPNTTCYLVSSLRNFFSIFVLACFANMYCSLLAYKRNLNNEIVDVSLPF